MLLPAICGIAGTVREMTDVRWHTRRAAEIFRVIILKLNQADNQDEQKIPSRYVRWLTWNVSLNAYRCGRIATTYTPAFHMGNSTLRMEIAAVLAAKKDAYTVRAA